MNRVMRGLYGAGAPLAAIAASLVAAAPGHAINVICMDDPPLTVTTPGGTNLTINNWISTSTADRTYLQDATVTGIARPDHHGGTLVEVYVQLPAGGSSPVTVSSVNQRTGASGYATASWGGMTEVLVDVPIP